jgi:hypothetical protein
MLAKTNQNMLVLSHFVKLQNRQKSDRTGSVNYSTVFNSKVHGCFKLLEQLSKRLQMFDLLYVFSTLYFYCSKYREVITVYQKQIIDETI